MSSGVPQDPSFSNAIHEIRRKSTRNEKLNHDKLAAFRDIWTLFTAQVTTFFVPGPYICVDEQLMAYYMEGVASVHEVHTCKVWYRDIVVWRCYHFISTDCGHTIHVYLGRQVTHPETGQGAREVKQLV